MNGLSAAGVPAELANETRFQNLTRLGFVARGILYLVIAWLVIGTGRTEDLTGALEYVGQGRGRILLLVMAAGLTAYGLWRLADAALGLENPGNDNKALWKRGVAGVIGAIYLYMAYKAVRVLTDGRAGASDPQHQADTVLDLPGGALILGLTAAVFAGAGIAQFVKSMKCSFLEPLDSEAMSPAVKWLGRLGYAARGVIFLLVGLLLARAALDGRSDEAGGMEQALDLMSGPLLYAVAAGLMLFGAFSIVEARYRRIRKPPVEQIEANVREKAGI